jgi:hypothetical protein
MNTTGERYRPLALRSAGSEHSQAARTWNAVSPYRRLGRQAHKPPVTVRNASAGWRDWRVWDGPGCPAAPAGLVIVSCPRSSSSRELSESARGSRRRTRMPGSRRDRARRVRADQVGVVEQAVHLRQRQLVGNPYSDPGEHVGMHAVRADLVKINRCLNATITHPTTVRLQPRRASRRRLWIRHESPGVITECRRPRARGPARLQLQHRRFQFQRLRRSEGCSSRS